MDLPSSFKQLPICSLGHHSSSHMVLQHTGSAQVPLSQGMLPGDNEVQGDAPGTLAGVSPHAPEPPKAVKPKLKPRRVARTRNFTIRLTSDKREKLNAKAAALECTATAYARRLIEKDLGEPIDLKMLMHSRTIAERIADYITALNKIGTLENQIAAAMNRGAPCPFSREELTNFARQKTALVNKILTLGFD